MGTGRRPRDAAFYAAKTTWEWGAWSAPEGGWIYAASEADAPLVKIGCAFALDTRLQAMAVQFHFPCIRIGAVQVTSFGLKVERYVHWLLKAQRVEGGWFYLHLSVEAFWGLVEQAVHAVEERRQQHVAQKRGTWWQRRARQDLCTVGGVVGHKVYTRKRVVRRKEKDSEQLPAAVA